MKAIVTLLILTHALFANITTEMFQAYKNRHYETVCKQGGKNFNANRNDEKFISLYAFGCLYSDHIDKLAIPIIVLKKSQEARANSAYFSTILMQKKLLYHALVDGYKISSHNLPSTEYIFSKVFDLYGEQQEQKREDFYIFQDKQNAKLLYKLYIEKHEKSFFIIIEEIYDTILIKKHIYK